jgi:hypothetical protein
MVYLGTSRRWRGRRQAALLWLRTPQCQRSHQCKHAIRPHHLLTMRLKTSADISCPRGGDEGAPNRNQYAVFAVANYCRNKEKVNNPNKLSQTQKAITFYQYSAVMFNWKFNQYKLFILQKEVVDSLSYKVFILKIIGYQNLVILEPYM